MDPSTQGVNLPDSPLSKALPSSKQEVRVDFEIHDRQQIEIEFSYPLHSKGTSTYFVDLFLFIPRNVGLSRQNYKNETFYQDLTAYLRMDTPPLTIEELANDQCSFSPLRQLKEGISSLEQETLIPRKSPPIAATVKLFGHAFRESIHTAYQTLRGQLEAVSMKAVPGRNDKNEKEASLLKLLSAFGEQGMRALANYHALYHRFAPVSGTQPPHTKELFEYVHEYISAYFIEKLAHLADQCKNTTALHNGSCFVATALRNLHRVASQVAKLRLFEGFVNPDPKHLRTAEFFTYRRGQIKKSMQQTFYLETRALRRDHFRRNIAAMLAAGLAAIWIFLIPSRTWQGFTDLTSILILVAIIIGYMLRDRTQELVRAYLGRKLHNYDHDTAILGENLSLLGLRGLKGRVREKIDWVQPSEVDEPISYLRTHPRTVAGIDITTEEVLFYQRALTLGLEEKAQASPGFALRDILRLNLRHFMTRLDDPMDEVRYYDASQDRFKNVLSPKVYHLNFILQVRNSVDGKILMSRHRVVLNQERILRFEKIEPSG